MTSNRLLLIMIIIHYYPHHHQHHRRFTSVSILAWVEWAFLDGSFPALIIFCETWLQSQFS